MVGILGYRGRVGPLGSTVIPNYGPSPLLRHHLLPGNITSAGAVDREFVNIYWAQWGPNIAQLGSNLIKLGPNWAPLRPLWIPLAPLEPHWVPGLVWGPREL